MCDVSIVLVNYRNIAVTKDCIRSILSSDIKCSYEIIVVDNDSRDQSAEKLQSEFPGIKVIESGRNGGFSFANNIAARLAEGDYLLLLNNDTIVYEGTVDVLLKFYENHSDVGLLGCLAVDSNNVLLPIAHKYEDLKKIYLQTYIKPVLEELKLQRKLVQLSSQKQDGNSEFIEADWIAGSALFIKSSLYKEVNGLDENFFMYMEDEDLSRRVHELGYKVGILTMCGYMHLLGGSTIQSSFLTTEYMKSRLVFFKRYNGKQFNQIKKALYRQIHSVNPSLDKSEIIKIRHDLDVFIENELNGKAGKICGIG